MKQYKRYRYIGRNGIITSAVLLDGINHLPMMYLEADAGFILTDGETRVRTIIVEADELHKWYEVVDNTK